mmetsp:Transcript_20222/g.33521  ORF Transcript_20222/g.33521 Transcript_20222/m.33521 type:complete len:155 (+) Transcript_20222:503-967(+)
MRIACLQLGSSSVARFLVVLWLGQSMKVAHEVLGDTTFLTMWVQATHLLRDTVNQLSPHLSGFEGRGMAGTILCLAKSTSFEFERLSVPLYDWQVLANQQHRDLAVEVRPGKSRNSVAEASLSEGWSKTGMCLEPVIFHTTEQVGASLKVLTIL